MTFKSSKSKYFKEVLLVNVFIITLFISSITNYSFSSFILKVISTAILWSIIIADSRISKFDFKEYFSAKHFKRLLLILCLFIIIPSISLAYSQNFSFGLLKLLSLTISTIPTILAFLYILLTFSKTRYQIFLISIIIITFLTVGFILIIQPFSYHDMNIKDLLNWSHVIYGRFIGCVYIIILFFLLNQKNKKLILLTSFCLSIIVIGVYISGLRSMILGVIIFTPLIVLTTILQKKINLTNFTGLLISIIISLLIISIFSPGNKTLTERLENLRDTEELRFNLDGPIHTRYHFYKISLEILKERPILGVGFGGFRNYKNDALTNTRKYPHNIFLEFAVELGIPGLLLLLLLLYIIFSSARKVSLEVFIFFLFALWLAMFSKDIPSQSLLWIGIAFYGIRDFRLLVRPVKSY